MKEFTKQYKVGNLVTYRDQYDRHGLGNGVMGIITEKMNRHGRYGILIGDRTVYIQHWLLVRQ